jgi:hypothetical protein
VSKVLLRVVAAVALLGFVNTACFNTYRISTSELELLQSGNEAESVSVCVAAAEVDEGPVRVAQDGDSDVAMVSSRGCETVEVSLTNAVEVITSDGGTYRVTPFNFTMSETQLVSPDYNLLLVRDQIDGAEVQVFSTGKTIGLVVGIAAIGVGSFLALSLLAGEDRGLGGN